MGYLGVKTLNDIMEGKDVEAEVNPGVVIATPDNYLEPDIYAVLYPEG
mgnify:CR=1 FL=1